MKGIEWKSRDRCLFRKSLAYRLSRNSIFFYVELYDILDICDFR